MTGGPGGAGTFTPTPEIKDYNVIKVDARGLGCNYNRESSMPSDLITTEQTVQDVVEVIRRLKLQSYAVYGWSYGTVLATVLTAALQEAGLPLPKAVVFQGTLGRSLESYAEYNHGFTKIWENLKK